MSWGELAIVMVCSSRVHTLSLIAMGTNWAADPPAVLNSLSHTDRADVFTASLG